MKKITPDTIRNWKGTRRRISALTAYDFPTARLLDEAGIDLLLVGDSLGMTVLGYPDTTHVQIQEVIHHTRAVVRGVSAALVVADLGVVFVSATPVSPGRWAGDGPCRFDDHPEAGCASNSLVMPLARRGAGAGGVIQSGDVVVAEL